MKKNYKLKKKKTNQILEQLHLQRRKWQPHNRNVLYWFFYCVNGNAKVSLEAPHIMYCILCYSKFILFINLYYMKGLMLYYKTSGITCLKNHVDVDHSIIFKNIEEVNNLVKGNLEKQPTKKKNKCL